MAALNSILFYSAKNLWEGTKTFFQSIEPYQPLVSGVWIFAKALWKMRSKAQLTAQERELKRRVQILRKIHTEKKTDGSQRMSQLNYKLQNVQSEKWHTWLDSFRLGSLVFPHPGSNLWNSGNTLIGRLLSIRHSLKFLSYDPANRLNATFSAISALGTGTSFLKQAYPIQEYSPLCHTIIGISYLSMALEGILMAKNWLRQKFR